MLRCPLYDQSEDSRREGTFEHQRKARKTLRARKVVSPRTRLPRIVLDIGVAAGTAKDPSEAWSSVRDPRQRLGSHLVRMAELADLYIQP